MSGIRFTSIHESLPLKPSLSLILLHTSSRDTPNHVVNIINFEEPQRQLQRFNDLADKVIKSVVRSVLCL